ncbi:ring-1,2-phenylacetyl-CoA epoxidase subunit PaaE [Nocardioides marinisabuli]|uniref:Ring-1,2-phenylacetyl-CoA epoxidase subunit PaaE n=1 Tax=Nocardioides marinisabuli TaxID=419476 RepID=A0A7Y9EXN6_9ACTN|nr:fatty acid desaturase [Nocardioides marinisabuli]NYD55845.1 ring-1,2-phenylacetyl-CoA epoxidase subunit PaaE [Nocardioides marinisabuli]
MSQTSSTPAPPAAAPQAVLGLPDPGERVPPVAWPTLGLYAGTLALFALELYGALVAGWSPWLTVPMGTAVTFLMFSVLHEATHHAVSTSTRLNDLMGHLSVPLVAPYGGYGMFRFIHIEHHRNTNEQKSVDPDAWTSEGPWWQLPFRWATLDLWYVVFYARRARQRPRGEVAATAALAVVSLAGFAALVAAGHGAALAVAFLVPQRLGLVVLAWWFDYLPHHGLPFTGRQDRYRATRIRVGGERWMTPLFVYQNYHLVHHLHPSVPFYRYVRAWRRNEEAYLDRNAAISTVFGRSLTPAEYRTWRRLTSELTAGREATSSSRPTFHPLRVASVAPLTDDSVAVTLTVPPDLARAYEHRPGQHVTLRAMVEGLDVRRSYSLLPPASEGTLRVAVKRIEGGVFSTYVHESLAADDILDVMTPAGRFGHDPDPSAARAYAAVAAGSGITPVLSILAATLEAEPASTVTLVYGNRTGGSTMLRSELDALVERSGGRLVVHHVLSREPGAPLPGRVTPDLVERLVPGPVDTWFLCGPEPLVEELRGALAPRGGRVLSEVFHTGTAAGDVGLDIESRVTVAVGGRETTFALRSTGDTVLDAALQQGVDAPYSCAGGACGTCRAKVLLGRAVMDQDHVLDDAERAAGYVLTCQAHPVSEELRVDYDA